MLQLARPAAFRIEPINDAAAGAAGKSEAPQGEVGTQTPVPGSIPGGATPAKPIKAAKGKNANATGAGAPTDAPTAVIPAEAPAASPAVPPAAPVAAASPEDVRKALTTVFEKRGMAKAQALLARFGAQRGADLKPEQLGDFVAKAQAVVDGSYDPEAGN
jgi:hypothetical protein